MDAAQGKDGGMNALPLSLERPDIGGASVMVSDDSAGQQHRHPKLHQRHMEAHSLRIRPDADASHAIINTDFRRFRDISCNNHFRSPVRGIVAASTRAAFRSRQDKVRLILTLVNIPVWDVRPSNTERAA